MGGRGCRRICRIFLLKEFILVGSSVKGRCRGVRSLRGVEKLWNNSGGNYESGVGENLGIAGSIEGLNEIGGYEFIVVLVCEVGWYF